MTDKFISERNLKFLIYDVFDAASLTQYPYYEEHNREIFDMVLETAMKIGKDLLRPNLEAAKVVGLAPMHPWKRGANSFP
jgi:butyryl-CoA dehydrogenase